MVPYVYFFARSDKKKEEQYAICGTNTITMASNFRRSKRFLDTSASPDAAPAPSRSASASVTPDIPLSSSAHKRVKSDQHSPLRPDSAPSSLLLFDAHSNLIKSSKNESGTRPSPEECAYVVHELGKLHPGVLSDTKEQEKQMGACGAKRDILDGVVSTMLSQNTTNANSTRAFANLKKKFPTWDAITKLKRPTKLEEAIHCGGLAKIKAHRILTICQTLEDEQGSPPSLEYLREFSNEQIQKELMRFPGLGKKTVSCVLLFTLGRDEFPVDTHVHRICKQLKWIPPNFSRDDAYDYLNSVVPPALKRDLHCLLIQHGRECHRCAARGRPQFPPKDGTKLKCPLVNFPGNKSITVKVEY